MSNESILIVIYVSVIPVCLIAVGAFHEQIDSHCQDGIPMAVFFSIFWPVVICVLPLVLAAIGFMYLGGWLADKCKQEGE